MNEFGKTLEATEAKKPETDNFKEIKPESDISAKEARAYVDGLFATAPDKARDDMHDTTPPDKANKNSSAEDRRKQFENKEAKQELVNDYLDDLKLRISHPEDVKEDVSEWVKISPEECKEKREEFDDKKKQLIAEWENQHSEKWPTYSETVYDDKTSTLVRIPGMRYDAHHIKPLTYGGENIVSNITPIHLNDHKKVHNNDSPFSRLAA